MFLQKYKKNNYGIAKNNDIFLVGTMYTSSLHLRTCHGASHQYFRQLSQSNEYDLIEQRPTEPVNGITIFLQ